MRGAIDCVLVAIQLTGNRGMDAPADGAMRGLVYDAMVVSLSGRRIHIDEAVVTTPERILRQIWEDHFILQPAAAATG